MGSKLYETPPDFFRARWDLHRFNVDAAASDENALVRPHCESCALRTWKESGDFCDQRIVGLGGPCVYGCGHYIGRYYTEETDGLDPSHYVAGDRVWDNPPYDASIIRWVRMFRELAMDAGVMSELLLPASTDTRWFMKHLWNDEAGHWRDGVDAHFVGRVQFLLNGQPILDKHGKRVSSRQANMLVTLKARTS